MFVNRQATYQHPSGVASIAAARVEAPALSLPPLLRPSLPPSLSHPCTGLRVPRSSGLLGSSLYTGTQGSVYLLSVIISQIAGGKRGIILSADANRSWWDGAGLGYGSFQSWRWNPPGPSLSSPYIMKEAQPASWLRPLLLVLLRELISAGFSPSSAAVTKKQQLHTLLQVHH